MWFLGKYVSDLKKEFAGYNAKIFSQDLMAGLTVAAVALPLALAFGVSSGADAAAGMITAIFAGVLIGTLSGASYQISGPTGAMSALLLPIAAQYGVKGVMMAGFLSGVLLLIAALLRMGKLVSFIPAPVITGFTSGIAIIIALGQIDNFFGTTSEGTTAVEKLLSYGHLGFQINAMAVFFGLLVVAIMLVYPKKWQAVVPSSLVGIIAALVVNLIMNPDAAIVAEVGDIPRTLVSSNGLLASGFDFTQIKTLLPVAISIAALGMIESLLCGASAGKMTGEKMDSQRELIAQGIGNLLIPLFGGVPATAAIARTSVAIKSGGRTRMVSIIHALTLVASMFLLGGVMSRIPLSALAGVLMVTAWRMNEWHEIRLFFRKRWWVAIAQFLVTMVSTVIFDLTIAIVVGVFAALLFYVVNSYGLEVNTSRVDSARLRDYGLKGDFENESVIYIVGAVFFANQEQMLDAVRETEDGHEIILSMRGVPSMEICAAHALAEEITAAQTRSVTVKLCSVQERVMKNFLDAGVVDAVGRDHVYWDTLAIFRAESKEKENV
ncbi:MAG: SulP family inorganic anion transporter [Oscillospiraceae bacterium]|nr:SulP family inorganic anion transporter [Oscillospiraceae bacterium]